MKLAPIGDSAVIVTLGETPDAPTVAAVRALAAALDAKPFSGLIECAPTNASLTVFYDPARVATRSGESPFERVCGWIEAARQRPDGPRFPPDAR